MTYLPYLQQYSSLSALTWLAKSSMKSSPQGLPSMLYSTYACSFISVAKV